MIFWYAAGAVFIVWNVFQSPGLDMRFVAMGALLPVVIDAPFGRQMYAHALLAPIVVLTAVMLATLGRGHRLRRRKLLGFPIGWFCGLVLAGTWAHKEVFWWPLFGTSLPHVGLYPALGVAVAEELLGLAALSWCYTRFGLRDPKRRAQFVRSGRVGVVSS